LLLDQDRLIAQGRRPWPFRQRRLLVLDGTANAEILKQFVPALVAAPEIRVRRNARVIQVSNSTFYKGSLIKRATASDGTRKPEPKARLLEVADFIERTACKGKTLVVTNKPVRCVLTGEDAHGSLPISAPYRGADIAHFGNLRGSNEFERHEIVIILGRDEPSVADAERRAMAIWYDTKEPIRPARRDYKGQVNYPVKTRRYQMSNGTKKSGNVSVHPDPRVQAVVEQAREAEMIQAIDRLRLIHTEKRKTVYILCSIPLDIPVDELVTWKQLTGDRRLADALAECDERGWNALPLAAKELTRLFPALLNTKKAAERWIAKNPPETYRDIIIRVWGVLNTYRRPGQTSWSKAVVRHGADPRMALATVLGLAAGDIQEREAAQGPVAAWRRGEAGAGEVDSPERGDPGQFLPVRGRGQTPSDERQQWVDSHHSAPNATAVRNTRIFAGGTMSRIGCYVKRGSGCGAPNRGAT
jgi:broad specificity phosphatase PhoE